MHKLSEQDIEKNNQMYDAMMEVGNPNYWFGTHKEDNYNRMVLIAQLARFPLEKSKCLDVGCGTGDFSAFLRQRSVCDYLGIDIYEPSLSLARDKHPNEMFLKIDMLQWETSENFDFVFCSGALSTKLASDNYQFINSMISKMWALSKVGVAINFLIDDGHYDSDIFHYSLPRVLKMCEDAINSQGKLFHRVLEGEAHVYLYGKS